MSIYVEFAQGMQDSPENGEKMSKKQKHLRLLGHFSVTSYLDHCQKNRHLYDPNQTKANEAGRSVDRA
jgi:hypothetical protein